MLPDGWQRVPLHEVAEVRTGLAKGKTGQRDPVDLPYLRVANVQDGHLDLSEIKTITVEREHVERYSLRHGDILMTEGGDFDKLGRGDVWQNQIDPCLHQNHVFAVRPHSGRVVSFFLAALAASRYGRTYFLSCAKRSTNLASINSSQLKAFPVLLPPLGEQQFIARVLTTWDEMISTTERMLANSRKQKQALIASLVSARKPSREKNPNWEQSTLSQIADIVVSSVDKKKEQGEREVQLCNYTDVYYNDCIHNRLSFMRATASDREIEKFSLRRGDVIITKDSETAADIAVSARVTEDIPNLVCGYHLAIVKPDLRRIDPVFLHSYFSLPRTKFYFASKANGVTRFGLPLSAIQDAPCAFPSIAEQREIAQIISSAECEISSRAKEVDLLKTQKQSLQAQLLTGKRRVRPDGMAELTP